MFRFKIPTTVRLSLGLSSVTASLLLLANTIGLFPDSRTAVVKSRAVLCESLAIHFSLLADKDEAALMKASLSAIVARNSEIRSVAVRKASGHVLLNVGDHAKLWQERADGLSTDSQMRVPIYAAQEPWGQLEVVFEPLSRAGWMALLDDPLLRMLAFTSFMGVGAYFLFLKRVLLLLNPSKAVPGRVRTALDTLTQGLLILDNCDRIVLANQSFSQTLGVSAESLVGQPVGRLPWRDKVAEDGQPLPQLPWKIAALSGQPCTGVLLDLQVRDGIRRTFVVNAAPILNDQQGCQGVLASLEDITPLEQKKFELQTVIEQLHESAKQVNQQNAELERMAMTDPLTGCLNRRAFFSQYESVWESAARHGRALSSAMVDIDFFKSVNDEHGHAMGDEVLKRVAEILLSHAGPQDLVCRFGGEEFSVLFPNQSLEAAAAKAEQFRVAIQAAKFEKLTVTASLGCATRTKETASPQQVLENADKSLYYAKRTGRNRVIRWDEVPTDLVVEEKKISRVRQQAAPAPAAVVEDPVTIPYHAVAALLSALAFRHRPTAEHCRRVADLAVSLANTHMPFRDCYVLEIAALLHDIGKIGVPDHILLKREPLDAAEWEIMHTHDQIGVEIAHAAFSSPALSQILDARPAFYSGSPKQPHLPVGQEIPLGSRILAIADAYDSMTHASIYRAAMPREQALAELRRCAGTQFDPGLVEEFILIQQSPAASMNHGAAILELRAAVDIGSQIERLMTAIDDRNVDGLKALADRLHKTAAHGDAREIAEKAERLRAAAASEDQDLINILSKAGELVKLCRSTQRILLAPARPDSDTGRCPGIPAESIAEQG